MPSGTDERPLDTVTVGELKELLEDYPDDMPVVFAYNHGDYWRTTVTAEIKKNRLGEGAVVWSGYHRMYKEYEESEKEGDEGMNEFYREKAIPALILR